jgi:hypothetical protein
MSANNGGPAFTAQFRSNGSHEWIATNGMTLRDWFAGQALAGYMADPNLVCGDSVARQRVAKVCYGLADAMLEARAT